MKSIALLLSVAAAFICSTSWAQVEGPLLLDAKIPLGNVSGRIDHMAIDLGRRRLLVAELENHSVGIVDLNERKVIQVILNMNGPQGLGYVPSTDTLYVANGGDGSLQLLQCPDYVPAGRIDLGEGADNVRVDSATNQILVSRNGGLAVIDAARRYKIFDIELLANPESFQLDSRSGQIFVNDPTGHAIIVVDRTTGNRTAVWRVGNGSNFPMVLDEGADQVLVVFRNPTELVAFGMLNGAPVTSVETCQDADDVFLDAKRRRVYVSCGEGVLDVFDVKGTYRRLARVKTVPGARTSLFVPEVDRLFVAVRATPEEPAAIWVFRPAP